MSRLGMLYAITADELAELQRQDADEMYDYMMDNIEDEYFGTVRACELDKAWEGLHYCLNGGEWLEDTATKSLVIFAGDFLLDGDDYVITHKSPAQISEIVTYLNSTDLESVIRAGFPNIPAEEYGLPKDDNNLNYLLGWYNGIQAFYENALANGYNVIFTVDL